MTFDPKTMIDWARYPNFSKDEFACKHTGFCNMDPKFLEKLQGLRLAYGRPMAVTSGYRHPTHPLEAAKPTPGTHAKGIAADIRVGPGEDVWDIVFLAMNHGFTGIGVSQRQGKPRFIHLDIGPNKRVWGY